MAKDIAVVEPRRSIVATVADRYGMEPDAFEQTLRKTVFKEGTREEFAAFLVVANEHRLNPLTKEIFGFKGKNGGIQAVVSVDGWARILNEHPQMDGFEFVDEKNAAGELESITCRIFRKDRSRPGEATEYMAECAMDKDTWKKWPRRMLRHKALIQAARYTFGFAGIVDEDEYERTVVVSTPRPSLDPGFPVDAEFEAVEAPRTAEAVVAHPTAGATAEAVGAPQGGQDGGVSGEEAKIVATDDGGAPTGERVDQANGEVTGAAEQRQGESAPAAAAPKATPASATPASGASAAATSSPAPRAEPSNAGAADLSEGVAGPGEEYHLTRDEPGPMGMRPAYKDGLRVGDSGPGAELFTYANHAPRLEDKKPAGEPASKSPPSSSVSPPADDFPGDRPSTEAHPFIEAIGKIAEAEHWDAIKQVARTLAGTALWKESERSARMPVQEAMWDRYCELPDQIAVSMDYTLMSLWLRFGANSLAEIDEMWPTFWRKGAYKDSKDADKLAITELMEQRKAAFRAPAQ